MLQEQSRQALYRDITRQKCETLFLLLATNTSQSYPSAELHFLNSRQLPYALCFILQSLPSHVTRSDCEHIIVLARTWIRGENMKNCSRKRRGEKNNERSTKWEGKRGRWDGRKREGRGKKNRRSKKQHKHKRNEERGRIEEKRRGAWGREQYKSRKIGHKKAKEAEKREGELKKNKRKKGQSGRTSWTESETGGKEKQM
jgi:hypothetical protein